MLFTLTHTHTGAHTHKHFTAGDVLSDGNIKASIKEALTTVGDKKKKKRSNVQCMVWKYVLKHIKNMESFLYKLYICMHSIYTHTHLPLTISTL